MPITHQGKLDGGGKRFAIVASRWNDFIVDKLLNGALQTLKRSGVADDSVEIFRCPGALEIPGLVKHVIDTKRFDGIVCLGAVIRGATPHFDLVINQSASGVAQLAIESGVAVGFGVLACDNIEQGLERAGDNATNNRGADAAAVAIEMADLYAQLAGRGA